MPYLDSIQSQSEGGREWQLAIKNCLLRRIKAEQLSKAFKTLHTRHRVPPQEIAGILLGFRAPRDSLDDPLVFSYLKQLLKEKYISTGDLLLALLKRSHFKVENSEHARPRPSTGLPCCEERIFLLLAHKHMTTELPSSPLDTQRIVFAIHQWLKTVSEYEMGKQLEGAGLYAIDTCTYGMYEALGSLAISVLGNRSIRILSKQRWWKSKRGAVVAEMTNYDTHILQWMNSQLAGRLRTLTGMPPYIELDSRGRPIFSDQQILDSISDVPIVQSRAGLFVWLSAALTARPMTDDMTILSYLHARYPGAAHTSLEELLVASFDVFTNAVLRKESVQTQKIIRSFICNKIPVLISMLSSNIAPPMTAETCIQMALTEPPAGTISMNPLPPITHGAEEVRESLKRLRLDFLQACALHGHVAESTVGTILGENVALPRVTKYNKESLIAQCANSIGKLEGIVADLDGMQGNTAAIAGCIIETINNLCISKDSMSLKTVCNELLKKIPSMDFVMLFAHPGLILLPLCTLLNEWIHDQEQTEFTPAYEEFASILLFSLNMIHRYDLNMSEIGILQETFVARLLTDMYTSRSPAELSPEQNSQLAKWIESLFAVDENGESSGIGDDVMRNCSPQAFYELVPTLLEQSVVACRSNALPMKTFKIGLELLLEPFLLPALVMGLRWMAEHSWEDHNDTEILLQVLDKLLKPSSSSQDTKTMHHAVLAMVAVPLYDSLQDLIQKHTNKKHATELSELLKRYIGGQRSLKSQKAELDEWIQSDGSPEKRLQRNIQELVIWASTTSSPPNPPPKHTHRIFAVTCQILEADVVLQVFVDELMQTSTLPIALDICTALICAPSPTPIGAQQSNQCVGPTGKLRETVRLIGSNIQSLLDKKQGEAEALVRLGRRVAAQLAVVQLPPIAMPIQMQEQTADQIMQDLGIDLPGVDSNTSLDSNMDQATGITDLGQQLNLSADQEIANLTSGAGTGMDLDQSNIFDDMTIDMSQGQQNNQQIDLQSQEEDIFAGLDSMGMEDLGDDDFNFG